MSLSRSDFPEAFNGGFSPAVTTLRCPKCSSREFELTESMEALTTFEVRNGLVNRQAGIHEFGSYFALNGRCNACFHSWKIRKAIQIDDALVELDPETFKPVRSALSQQEESRG